MKISNCNNFENYRFLTIPRDLNYEASLIRASRVELLLRKSLSNSTILKYFPGRREFNGVLVSHSGHIVVAPDQSYNAFPPTEFVGGALSIPINGPLILSRDIYGSQTPINDRTYMKTPFVMVRLLSHLYNGRMDAWFPELLNRHDHICVNRIAAENKLDGSWEAEDSYDEGCWKRAVIEHYIPYAYNCSYCVLDHSSTTRYLVEILNNGSRYAILPSAVYQKGGCPAPLKLFIPPRESPMLGEEFLSAHPNAHVIISTEFALPMNNYIWNPSFVSLALLGGKNAFKKYDMSPLRGRKVSWILFDWQREGTPTMIKAALKFYRLARRFTADIDFTLLKNPDCRPVEGIYLEMKPESVERMSIEGLCRMAEKEGVWVPDDLRPEMIISITGDRLEKLKRQPYLLDPVIREGSMTVIYGGAGCGKSQVAISMCCALSAGKPVFGNHWKSIDKNGVKCLTIAGEMDNREYGERINFFQRVYGATEEQKKNFVLNSEANLDLAADDAMKRLDRLIKDATDNQGIPGKPVKFIVFDNLTTLSTEGENPTNFSKINWLMRKVAEKGIAVVLIHHENASGDLRGARKIGDVMTTKFHLFKGERKGDELAILVKNEKQRANKSSEMVTIKVVIDMEKDHAWKVVPLSAGEKATVKEESELGAEVVEDKPKKKVSKTLYKQTAWKCMSQPERVQAIVKEVNLGFTNEQIAANHSCGLTTITDFRRDNKLRDCDLKDYNMDD